MRIEKEKVVIPEKIIEQEVYICERCGTRHKYKNNIFKCKICGKEICSNCRKKLYTYNDNILDIDENNSIFVLGETAYLNENVFRICRVCYPKILVNHYQNYLNNIKKLVNKFNTDIKELNNKYLKGELNG